MPGPPVPFEVNSDELLLHGTKADLHDWVGHSSDAIQGMYDGLATLRRESRAVILD